MDIYNFINSSAIADHCCKLNHQFTPVEMAYLIHESEKHTVPEKHAVFRELIDTTADVEILERLNTKHFASLHDYLEQYMQIENKYIELFYHDEPDCVYSYKYLCKDDYDYTTNECIYKNFHSCYKKIQADIDDLIKSYKKDGEELIVTDIQLKNNGAITKKEESPHQIILSITHDNIPVSLWEARGCMKENEVDVYYAFDGLWPEIPTPFQKGDILIGKSKYWLDMKPVVLERIPYWAETEAQQRLLERYRKYGDSSDLLALVYEVDTEVTIWQDHGPDYLYLEYYDKKLEGAERILTAVSNYLKGGLEFDLLMCAYDFIKREAYLQEERGYWNTFTKESRIKAGIMDAIEDK